MFFFSVKHIKTFFFYFWEETSFLLAFRSKVPSRWITAESRQTSEEHKQTLSIMMIVIDNV